MIADDARKWTDKQLEKLEKKVTKVYADAEKELNKKWKAYLKGADKKVSALEKEAIKQENLWNKGKGNFDSYVKSIEDLKAAKKKYTLQNTAYKNMVDSVTKDIADVNQQALSIINGRLSDIYNVNFQQVRESVENLGVDFSLADKATVNRMIKDGDIKLPKKKISVPADQQWNTKKINSSVLQGILQGESIPDIAKRLEPIINTNRTSAIRNARTLVTGAENRGRLDSYKELEKQGAVIHKVWLSTADGRTRDWHIDMDGQEVGLKEDFIDGLGNELEYPGDPGAAPETVYNCRCSMTSEIIGFKDENGNVHYIERDEKERDLHDIQIGEERERRAEENPQSAPIPRDNAYSQARKDSALWAQTEKEYDDVMREMTGEVWRNATEDQKYAAYDYTSDSSGYNSPLRRHSKVADYEADRINDLTGYIDQSELICDTWLQRGVDESGSAKFLGIDADMFYGSVEDMRNAVMDKVVRDEAFFSCGSSKGSGFDGVVFNVYCPQGTKAAYCEPFSYFGSGDGFDWNGFDTQTRFGSEFETLLQRGSEFRVTKIEKDAYGDWFFDIEVVGQNPAPLKDILKIY